MTIKQVAIVGAGLAVGVKLRVEIGDLALQGQIGVLGVLPQFFVLAGVG
jgi:hypothetical protein